MAVGLGLPSASDTFGASRHALALTCRAWGQGRHKLLGGAILRQWWQVFWCGHNVETGRHLW